MTGTWNTFNAPSGLNADTMLLLTDGTVLVHDANRPSLSRNLGGANWYRLTPDDSGDYRNGKWSGALPMAGQRQFFASGVLKDGRVYVVGGEFSDILGNTDTSPGQRHSRRNLRSRVGHVVGDDQADARLRLHRRRCDLDRARRRARALRRDRLVARTAIWDPSTDSWIQAGTRFGTVANTKIGKTNEESWCLLPNDNVLTVQTFSDDRDAERRDVRARGRPMDHRRGDASTLPIGASAARTFNEIGGAVTLQNGMPSSSARAAAPRSHLPARRRRPRGLGRRPGPAGRPTNANSPNRLQTSIDGACVAATRTATS